MATANIINTGTQADFAKAARKALIDRGLTVTQLARHLKLARNTVSIAINHPTMFPGVKARITKFLAL